MSKQVIGLNAGIVWKLLSDNRKWDYETLKQHSGLTDLQLGAAIGWLAREDKIEFHHEESHTNQVLYIYLCINYYIG